jgi:hypothetical protein
MVHDLSSLIEPFSNLIEIDYLGNPPPFSRFLSTYLLCPSAISVMSSKSEGMCRKRMKGLSSLSRWLKPKHLLYFHKHTRPCHSFTSLFEIIQQISKFHLHSHSQMKKYYIFLIITPRLYSALSFSILLRVGPAFFHSFASREPSFFKQQCSPSSRSLKIFETTGRGNVDHLEPDNIDTNPSPTQPNPTPFNISKTSHHHEVRIINPNE